MSKIEQLIEYLKMPSTWRGIVLILGVAGVKLTPEWQNAILTAMVLVHGAIDVMKRDTNTTKQTTNQVIREIKRRAAKRR